MTTSLRRGLLILIAVATIRCDQMAKHAASAVLFGLSPQSYLAGTLRVSYAENTGAFLSMGASLPPITRTLIFTVGVGCLLLAASVTLFRSHLSTWAACGLALLVSGGLSNWMDRLAHGRVVDFLNLGVGPVRTGIFNLADVAIMSGALLFAYSELRGLNRRVPPETPT